MIEYGFEPYFEEIIDLPNGYKQKIKYYSESTYEKVMKSVTKLGYSSVEEYSVDFPNFTENNKYYFPMDNVSGNTLLIETYDSKNELINREIKRNEKYYERLKEDMKRLNDSNGNPLIEE